MFIVCSRFSLLLITRDNQSALGGASLCRRQFANSPSSN